MADDNHMNDGHPNESNYICVIEIYPYGTFYHDLCCQLINLFLFIYYNFNYIVGHEHVIIHVVWSIFVINFIHMHLFPFW